MEDLKKTFTYGFTAKEVEDLFRLHDQDRDGKLGMEDFIRIILPPDYVIEDEAEDLWKIYIFLIISSFLKLGSLKLLLRITSSTL